MQPKLIKGRVYDFCLFFRNEKKTKIHQMFVHEFVHVKIAAAHLLYLVPLHTFWEFQVTIPPVIVVKLSS